MVATGNELIIWVEIATILVIAFSFMWGIFIQYWLYPRYKNWLNYKKKHSKEIGECLGSELNDRDVYFEKENFDIHIIKGEKDFQISDKFILALKHLEDYHSLSEKWQKIEDLFKETKKELSELKEYILDKIKTKFKEDYKKGLFKGLREIIDIMLSKEGIEKVTPNQMVLHQKNHYLYINFDGVRVTRFPSDKSDEGQVKKFYLGLLNNPNFQDELKNIKTNHKKIEDDLKKYVERINNYSSNVINGKEKLRKKICDDCHSNFWLYNLQ